MADFDEQPLRVERFELLASVSAVAAASLDPDVAVQNVAQAVVPAFCDWCVVDLALEGGELGIVATAHRDPGRQPLISELRTAYPPSADPDELHPIHRVIRDGRSVLDRISDDDLQARASDARHLELLRGVGIGSHVVAPLVARGAIIGALSFVRAPDRAPFDDADLLTGEDVARRAAVSIDNATLYRAAQEAARTSDEFMAIASHELRTPLAVVQGHWDLLQRMLARATAGDDAFEPERFQRSLDRLGSGISQLRRLTDELLDVSRLRHTPLAVAVESVDLGQLVRVAVADSPAASRVELAVSDAPLQGNWDPDRLRQVVDNLLANAAKYAPDGSPIEVSLASVGRVARLTVTDHGIGVPDDDREAIFTPFGRAHNAAAGRYPGLGLGLSVSREIVVQMGGRIWVESGGEGAGSTFSVELPTNEPSPED